MKKIAALACFLLFAFSAQAGTEKLDGLLRTHFTNPAIGKAALGKASVLELDREKISCLLKSSSPELTGDAIVKEGGEVSAVIGNIMSVVIPKDSIIAISDRDEVEYIEAAKPLTSKMNEARNFTRVSDVQAGTGLDQPYNGSGVFVGIVDDSLDWEHPDFSGTDGKTRICYIYEKTPLGGEIECTKSDIDDGDCNATLGGGYHGSHVTGIAAGANATYTGVAPQGWIGFAFNAPTDPDTSGSFSTSVLEGVSALFTEADSLSMPAVINLSLGTSWGAHDNTSLLEQGLNTAVSGKTGRVIVNAAGNENVNPNDPGAASIGGIHALVNESSGTNRGWKVVVRSTQISSIYPYSVVNVWLSDNAQCRSTTIEVKGYKQSANQFNTANASLATDAIDFNADKQTTKKSSDGTVQVDIFTYTTNTQNSKPNSLVFIGPSSTGTWGDIVKTDTPGDDGYFFDVILRVPSGSCAGDMWNYPDYTALNDFLKGYAPNPVAGAGPYVLADGDSNKTTTIPATASGVITAGSYMGRGSWVDIDGTTHLQTAYDPLIGSTGGTVGQLSVFSSLGPTADARNKPDVVAPGEPIISTAASGISFSRAILGDSTHVKLEGTSMSSPHVAGIAALMLQRNNCLTASQIKDTLKNTASAISGCGADSCGSGIANALSAMQQITADTSCYTGRTCGGGGNGGGGCGSSIVPVSAATGILSIIAVIVPIGILVARRRK